MNNMTLYSRIDKIANKHSNKVSIKHGEKHITYRELKTSSDKIFTQLDMIKCNSKNIALIMDRSIELVTSIIGVIKSGKVFVPISPKFPIERIKYILSKIKSDVIITTDNYEKELSELLKDLNIKIITISYKYIKKLPPYSLNKKIDYIYNEHCYIYFTSGTTGKPKGVVGRQSSLIQFLDWEINQFKVDERFNVSQIITPVFDAYLRDVFVPLLSGGKLIIPENDDIIYRPLKLINWLDKEKITLTHMVKSLFVNMARELVDSEIFASMKYILLSGEKLKGIDIKHFYAVFEDRIKIVNLYGTTETTMIKAFHVTNKEDIKKDNIPIGKPIDGAKLYLLNDELEESDTGEIYIESNYMTDGYYCDYVATKKSFITIKSAKGNKTLYKTGDIGTKNNNNDFICLDRVDRQIKIQGVRIEPCEIEQAMIQLLPIKEAIITAIDITENKKQLCGYYTAVNILNQDNIIQKLTSELPNHLIPTYFIYLEKMPYLLNGKIDKKALPNPINFKKDKENKFIDRYQKGILKIIKQVLCIENIDLGRSFIRHGGNSLDAANLAMKLHKFYDIDMTIANVLKAETINEIVVYVDRAQKNKYEKLTKTYKKQYPLTAGQKSIYIVSNMQDTKTSYNLPELIEINKNIDVNKLEQSYIELISQHDIFKTSFHVIDEQIMQIINTDVIFEIPTYIYNPREMTNVAEIASRLVKPFDLEKAPLIRAAILDFKDKKFLFTDVHHIILDGSSQELIKEKLSSILNGQNKEFHNQSFLDYSFWIKKHGVKNIQKHKKYWIDYFKGDIPTLGLDTDYPRKPIRSFKGDSITKKLDNQLCREINKIVLAENSTMYSFMISVFLVFLHRYAKQQDIIVGTPIASRSHADIQSTLGMFVNTLPLRSKIEDSMSFRDLMQYQKNNLLESIENQGYPLYKVVQDLDIKPSLSRSQLFDVMFILQKINNLDFGERQIVKRYSSKFDITMTVLEEESMLTIELEYSTDLYKSTTIENMLNSIDNIIKNVVYSNEDIKLKDINILSKSDKDKILNGFNNQFISNMDIKENIIEMINKQEIKHPEKIAIKCETNTISYKELQIRSDIIAHILIKENLKIDGVVALVMDRSELIIIAMLGVLKAGLSYLPIDMSVPQDRIDYIIKDSRCNIALTDRKFNLTLKQIVMTDILIDNLENKIKPINKCDLNQNAYIIYTSGSTGNPKGVIVSNKNLMSFILSITDKIEFKQEQKLLSLTTITFDIFVLESLLALAKGLTMVLASHEETVDPHSIERLIRENHVDILQLTPSRLNMLIDTLGMNFLSGLKTLIVGGEEFDEKLQKVTKHNDLKIYNVYGPTEATVWCSTKEIEDNENITIGKPLKNTRAYVLDNKMRIQPVGVRGELYLSGSGIARGYLGKTKLTKQRFINSPFDENKILYKTGDIVKWTEDGELSFIGRSDYQVKLRGYRIELKEIENHISKIEDISQCICDVKIIDNNKSLVAYYESKKMLNVAVLKRKLAKKVPHYMIPDRFVYMEKLPRTINEKKDRKNLPEINTHRPSLQNDYSIACTEVEKKILEIWEDILKINEIGVEDNFFDLGGNSLLLINMLNIVQREYSSKIKVTDIFANPTIMELSRYISSINNQANIENSYVNLPNDYFKVSDIYVDNIEYEFRDSTIKALKKFDEDEEYILLSYYMYLIHQINNTDIINIYTTKQMTNINIYKATIQISKYNNLVEIAKQLASQDCLEDITMDDLSHFKSNKKADEAMILFGTQLRRIDYDLFDIAISLEKKSIRCYYDSLRLNSQKVEELFDLYINIIENYI
ncbi:amino acid adenylation domain-containing protein [Clostridiaceae bacterium M8S5]|nr:amino acid adenylation domain-containing protein [Clostridiaceae bacterium M8S5]